MYGIYVDTHITHDQFGWLRSIFYVGYLAIQVGRCAMLHFFGYLSTDVLFNLYIATESIFSAALTDL